MATKSIDKYTTIGVVLGDANIKLSEKRAAEAARLFNTGSVKDIAAVGTHREVDAMLKVLLRNGVPSERISYDGDSRDTVDNFYQAAKLITMADEQNAKLLLITSRFHMARALHIFKKLGLYDTAGHSVHDTDVKVLYRYVLEVPMQLFSVANINFNKELDNKKAAHDLAEKIKRLLYRGDKEE